MRNARRVSSVDPTHLIKSLAVIFNLVHKRPIDIFAVYHLPLTVIQVQLVKAFAIMCTVQYEYMIP